MISKPVVRNEMLEGSFSIWPLLAILQAITCGRKCSNMTCEMEKKKCSKRLVFCLLFNIGGWIWHFSNTNSKYRITYWIVKRRCIYLFTTGTFISVQLITTPVLTSPKTDCQLSGTKKKILKKGHQLPLKNWTTSLESGYKLALQEWMAAIWSGDLQKRLINGCRKTIRSYGKRKKKSCWWTYKP